jgi:hypothetical protein
METLKSLPIRSSGKLSTMKIALIAVLICAVVVALFCIASGSELIAVAMLCVAAASDYLIRKI